MEPLRGGLLATPPAPIQAVFDETGLDPVATALRWLWAAPEVTMVLSGMSSLPQLEQNIDLAEKAEQVVLCAAERKAVAQARTLYDKASPIPCTQCGYCLPCPSGVFIPDNLSLYNKCVIFGSIDSGRVQYLYHTPDANKAGACTGCRECEDQCPQGIPISEWMPKIHEAFTSE